MQSPPAQVVKSLVRIRQVVQQHLTVADEKRTNEFLSAASRGDMQRVRAMLQQHFDPDAADYDGGLSAFRSTICLRRLSET